MRIGNYNQNYYNWELLGRSDAVGFLFDFATHNRRKNALVRKKKSMQEAIA